MKAGLVMAFVATMGMATASAAAADSAGTKVFKPVGQWSVDYGDDYCRLAHNFSDGSETLALAVERIRPGPMARMVLVSNAIKPFRSAEDIGWHFTPSDPERKARYTHAPTADGPEYYNLGEFMLAPAAAPGPPPPYDRQQEQAIAKGLTGFVLDSGLNTPVEVDTGDLSQPVAALQKCADDLAGTWGLDAARLQGQKSPPMPAGGGVGWLPQGTIPFADFGKLMGGSNQVRLMVDAAGKPTGCAIHWATLDPKTNSAICKALMDKAQFTPAKDAAGEPMASYWVASPMMLGPPMRGFGRR